MFQYFIESLLKMSDRSWRRRAHAAARIFHRCHRQHIPSSRNNFNPDFPDFWKASRDVFFQSLSSAVIGGYASISARFLLTLFFLLTTTFNVFMQGFLARNIPHCCLHRQFLFDEKSGNRPSLLRTLHEKILEIEVVVPGPDNSTVRLKLTQVLSWRTQVYPER